MISKENNFSEWYNKIVREADIIDDRYPIKGMPVYKPFGFKLIKNILLQLEKELDNAGFESCWFPALIPYEIFKKESEHIKGFEEEVFWVGGKNEKLNYILRPTSETEMYYMFRFWIDSYSDLPLKLYMTNTMYRYETKATKPLIRGREVLWNEAHTAHTTKEDADRMINKSIEIYTKLFWEFGSVPFIWVRRPEWDKFAGADYTIAADTILPDGRFLQIGTTHLLGQNFSKAFEIYFLDNHPFLSKERKKEIEKKLEKLDKKLKDILLKENFDLIAFSKDYKKVCVVKIKDNKIILKIYPDEQVKKVEFKYSEKIEEKKIYTGYKYYNLKYIYNRLEENQELINKLKDLINFEELDNHKLVWQTSFGVSMRFAAAVISIHGDDKGLVLPFDIAPIQIVIIPIYYSDEERNKVINYSKEIYNLLKDKYRVYLDLDDSKTPGWKFNYYEFKGVPIRIEIGKKEVEEKLITIALRRKNEKSKKYVIHKEELIDKIKDLIKEYDNYLKETARKYFESKIVRVKSLDELEKVINDKKVVKAPFCMSETCASILKEKYSVEVRGYDINPEKTNEKCIVCGKPGKYWVYIGKSY